LLRALRLIRILLPNPDRDDAAGYDFLPHSALAPLLLTSTVTEVLAELLRDDSIETASQRSDLYWAALDVLANLSTCEATLAVLVKERPEKAYSDGIGAWVAGKGEVAWERADEAPTPGKGKRRAAPASARGPIRRTGALFDHLRKLLKQSATFRKVEGARAEASGDESVVQALSLAGDLIDAGERIQKAVANLARATGGTIVAVSAAMLEDAPVDKKGKGKARMIEGGAAKRTYTEADYIKACEDLAFDSLETGVPMGHVFAKQEPYKMATHNAQHVNREIISLSTSLPPGIFLRVDEGRRELLKALIAGPEGTPYAHGLFEFDIYLPPQCASLSSPFRKSHSQLVRRPRRRAPGESADDRGRQVAEQP
jgi:baculoviral IAP repeat-containing protein 6